jgi:hypothetical protein
MPVVLLIVFAVVAWKFHAGALPSLAQVRGLFGH